LTTSRNAQVPGRRRYLFDVAIACQPDFDGGTCMGSFSFSLELGDLVGR
jgi:hypothetical protein